ncbi:MAG: UDP-glucose/GDP-mannose dehydrogenase family protein [Actinomycetes bacterium]
MPVRITVIGTGYLGAVHAACLAELGFEVLGVDSDPAKVAALQIGQPPFFEPGLADLLTRVLATGRLQFTTSLTEAADFGDVHFICVGTPQLPGSNAADLTQVTGAIAALTPLLTRPCLVIGKSTVPVGTASNIAELLTAAPAGAGVELAWNPEFLREGFAIEDTLSPDRLVFGIRSAQAELTLRSIYADAIQAGAPVVVTDFPTAELVKVAANAFLATKISFINAMAEVCEATGADVTELADALGHDPRIGRRFLNAGLGFGGGCLPKDIRAFMARADELGVPEAVEFLREVDSINLRRRDRTVAAARELAGGTLVDVKVACLGASFKPDSDDVRDSPALHVAQALHAEGALVRVTDPKSITNATDRYPHLSYVASPEAALAGADLTLLLTEWREYREIDPAAARPLVAKAIMLDGRNALDPQAWRSAGWVYRGIGRR